MAEQDETTTGPGLMEASGGEANGQSFADRVFGAVVYIALSLGAGSGLYTYKASQDLSDQVQDRYTGAMAARDFSERDRSLSKDLEIRDREIAHLSDSLKALRVQVEEIDRTHPPDDLINLTRDLNERLRVLEITSAKHHGTP